MMLAQGAPSAVFMSLCPLVGFVFTAVVLISGAIMLAARIRRTTAATPVSTTASKWPRRILIAGVIGLLLCVLTGLALLESPTHAWRNRTHTATVTAVDDQTNITLPLHVDTTLDIGDPDPFLVLDYGNNGPDQARVTWNVPATLVIHSEGYADKSMTLSGSLPLAIVVRLSPLPGISTISPAKQGPASPDATGN